MIYNQIPLDQEWKLPILHEFLKVHDDYFVLNNFVDNEIATMINFLGSDYRNYNYISILYSCFCLVIFTILTF